MQKFADLTSISKQKGSIFRILLCGISILPWSGMLLIGPQREATWGALELADKDRDADGQLNALWTSMGIRT